MVRIVDDGGHFDHPVDVVWKYVQSWDHPSAHTDRKNTSAKPLSENSAEVSWEQDVMGKPVKVVSRITSYAPVGTTIEVLEGPLAGSKFFQYYTPMGAKTGVTIVGEFTSKTVPEAQLESIVRQNFEHVFGQDTAALKEFAAKK
jgi:hypothetical protein